MEYQPGGLKEISLLARPPASLFPSAASVVTPRNHRTTTRKTNAPRRWRQQRAPVSRTTFGAHGVLRLVPVVPRRHHRLMAFKPPA